MTGEGGSNIKTYTSVRGGVRGFFGDSVRLYKVRKNNIQSDVSTTIEQKQVVEQAFASATKGELVAKDVLVLGGGQTSREVVAFGVANRVTAIDLDVIPQGWKPGQYVHLLKQNGPVRTVKTIGRKLLGVDRAFSKALHKQLGITQKSAATHLQMDASKMTFPDDSFDVVYSLSVFEHLPDPGAVLAEAIRVLRPNGLLYVSTHMYRADGGCHDLRIFAGDRAAIPFWAQLRPSVKHTVVESCYMNEWSLQQWRGLFVQYCPNAMLSIENHHEPFGSFLVGELARLRAGGELEEYTDEELLAVNVRCGWLKPAI